MPAAPSAAPPLAGLLALSAAASPVALVLLAPHASHRKLTDSPSQAIVRAMVLPSNAIVNQAKSAVHCPGHLTNL
jgi:hypothetical protein